MNNNWTASDVSAMTRMAQQGKHIREIAAKLGRTSEGVRRKLMSLGIKTDKAQRTTRK